MLNSSDMEFRTTTENPDLIGSHLRLLRQCFPHARHFNAEYLTWLYSQNPDGQAVGYDAFDDNVLVATYVCIPASIILRKLVVPALLSLNTATAPSHRGQGLFPKLAELTYELGKSSGFNAVFGVANGNSIRGFSGKLRFQDVAGLEARIGIGHFPRQFSPHSEQSPEFQRYWDEDRLNWRVSNPANRLALASGLTGTRVRGATHNPFIDVQCEVPGRFPITSEPSRFSLMRVSIGLAPPKTTKPGISVELPDRLKPSPLRLIYRNLASPSDRLDPTSVLFRFIDFDAY
jgi:GNAT superfamily N-acetyltransferase